MSNFKFKTRLSERIGKDSFFSTSADFPQILELRLEQIAPNPDQPRKTFSMDSLVELAASIDRHGLIQPITVQRLPGDEDQYLLVAGERRYRACELLERESIPAILTNGDPEEIGLIENIQREELNPLEEVEAMVRMMDRHHYTQEQLGQIVGKSQAAISKGFSLLSLPEIIKIEYRQMPTVGKWMLIEIAQRPSEDEQLATWQAIRSGQYTTVKSLKADRLRRKAPRPSPPERVVVRAGRHFIKSLESLGSLGLTHLSMDTYQELTVLRDDIAILLERLKPGEQNGDSDSSSANDPL